MISKNWSLKTFMILSAFVTGFVGVAGCKKTTPETALKGDYNHQCPCDDLECWRKNTRQGSKDALSCAASSLSAAADIATAGQASQAIGGIQLVAGVFDLAKNISAMASRTYKVSQDGLTTVNLAGLLKEIGTGHTDVLKYTFGTSYEKNPNLACWSDITKTASAVSGFVGALVQLNEQSERAKTTKRQFGFAEMGDISKGILSGVESSIRFGFALNACITNIADSSAAKDLKFLQDNIKKFGGYFKAGIALFHDCGINMLNSGYVLVQNSMCLAGDFKSLMASNQRLEDTLNSTLQRPAPNPPGDESGSTCNGEAKNCNTFAMRKFGIWLGQKSYYSYVTRSSLCADMCGNKGSGRNECEDNMHAIFQGDAPFCVPVCRTSQCEIAVNECLSFCCGQNAVCSDAARQKTVY
jgi:hypothetical protein